MTTHNSSPVQSRLGTLAQSDEEGLPGECGCGGESTCAPDLGQGPLSSYFPSESRAQAAARGRERPEKSGTSFLVAIVAYFGVMVDQIPHAEVEQSPGLRW